ncbi:MAG: hypothetical protein P1U64_10350 [Alcanivoracaceae bacterium]|nr:hypothetical protein [Alcanivoracaceae bacterium]
MSTASHLSKLPPRVARPLTLSLLALFVALFALGLGQLGGYLQAAIVMARCDGPQTTVRGTVSEVQPGRGHFWLWLGDEKVFFDDASAAGQHRPAAGEAVELVALACRRVWLGQDLWQLDDSGNRARQLQFARQLADARTRLWQPLAGSAVFVLVGLWVIATFFMATARAFSASDDQS